MQVGGHGWQASADEVGLVRLLPVYLARVLLGVNRHSADAQLCTGPEDADRDLTWVGILGGFGGMAENTGSGRHAPVRLLPHIPWLNRTNLLLITCISRSTNYSQNTALKRRFS